VALHKPPVVTLPIQTSACSNIRLDPQKSRCCKCCYFAKFRYGVPGALKTLANARSAEPHCWQTRPADLYQVAFIHRPVFRHGYPSSLPAEARLPPPANLSLVARGYPAKTIGVIGACTLPSLSSWSPGVPGRRLGRIFECNLVSAGQQAVLY
jgi:hypothetical protein